MGQILTLPMLFFGLFFLKNEKNKKINWLLSKHKSISISRFIDLSLYERGRGYYKKKKKVGEDFCYFTSDKPDVW